MGGRGASSGVTDNAGRVYGSQYTTLHESGNVKFVRYNESGSAKSPMETLTNGRVYATVNAQNEVKSITYYDKHNKRYKQIDIGHFHSVNGIPINPHTHKGYMHDEKGTYSVTPKEEKMIERVQKIWYLYNNRE